MTIAGLWRYGDWRHVATGCTALVVKDKLTNQLLLINTGTILFRSSCHYNVM